VLWVLNLPPNIEEIVMRALTSNEITAVSGGHPAAVWVLNTVVGGMVFEVVKAAYDEISNIERKTSTGGNMQRGR
jgi:hypothetical protein